MGASKINTDPHSARTAYLVLGMHRSGTSAVSQLLSLAGCDLPRNLMPGDDHNAQGYFEPWKIALFDDERLRAAGAAWDDPFAFPFDVLPAAIERKWAARAGALFDEEYGDVAWPLIKDPRVTLLLPFWRKVLARRKIALRCVIPVRHPLAVAGSLRRRDGFTDTKSVLVWTAYMLAAEAYTRDLPRAFISYDALLADWRGQVKRLEVAHGASLPRVTPAAARRISAALTPDLRHNADEPGLAQLGWCGALAEHAYAWFAAAARDETPPHAELAAVAAELEDWRQKIGALVSPAAHALDTVRAELAETRRGLAVAAALEAELRGDLARQREVLEGGWRRDVADLRRDVSDLKDVLGGLDAELDIALSDD